MIRDLIRSIRRRSPATIDGLDVDRVRDDDVFIVSYPKSGNTWMRFIIATLLSDGDEVSFRNVDDYVPDLTKGRTEAPGIEDQEIRFFKTHQPAFDLFPRTVYLVRDVRDVMISFYHYQVQKENFRGSFADFLSSRHPPKYGGWGEHVRRALDFRHSHPDRMLLLRYEDMLADDVAAVRSVVRFLRMDSSESEIEHATRECRFERLRQVEVREGPELEEHDDLVFFRRGKAGQWKSASEYDVEELQQEHQDVLTDLGYA